MNTDEPWKRAAPLPDSRSEQPANRRYRRAVALSDFARKLRNTNFTESAHFAESVVYWRHCVEHWEEYLDGKIAPQPGRGRKPTSDA